MRGHRRQNPVGGSKIKHDWIKVSHVCEKNNRSPNKRTTAGLPFLSRNLRYSLSVVNNNLYRIAEEILVKFMLCLFIDLKMKMLDTHRSGDTLHRAHHMALAQF